MEPLSGIGIFLQILAVISQILCVIIDKKNRNTHLKHVTQVVRGVYFMKPAFFVGFAVRTMIRHIMTHFVSIIDQSGMKGLAVISQITLPRDS